MDNKSKKLVLDIPLLGLGYVRLGANTEVFEENFSKRTAFFQIHDGPPDILEERSEVSVEENVRSDFRAKNSDKEFKVFTFGLFVIKAGSRIRTGYIKRRQVLVQA